MPYTPYWKIGIVEGYEAWLILLKPRLTVLCIVSNYWRSAEACEQSHTLHRLGQGVRGGTREELVWSDSEQVERLFAISMSNEQDLYFTVHMKAFRMLRGKAEPRLSIQQYSELLNAMLHAPDPLLSN